MDKRTSMQLNGVLEQLSTIVEANPAAGLEFFKRLSLSSSEASPAEAPPKPKSKKKKPSPEIGGIGAVAAAAAAGVGGLKKTGNRSNLMRTGKVPKPPIKGEEPRVNRRRRRRVSTK